MLWVREQFGNRCALNDASGEHHTHPVAEVCDDSQIVGDHQYARTDLSSLIADEVKDLRLDGDVETGRGLIGD